MKKQEPSSKEQELLNALSPIVNELIDLNYENSKDKIASQMAPLMGRAIREQIKSQKDDVVDALYPVLGNMISKYISKSFQEMLNSINAQVQDGLSFRSLKRKLKAKLKGVSETELLLEENARTNISSLLLIHKETGIVLVEVFDPEKPLIEPEMIASMMTAIRSFVNDWIEKNEEYSELGEIDYGGSKIIIENGGYSYLAAIIDGPYSRHTYEKVRKVFENIVENYGEEIREFNGDLNDFPNLPIYNQVALLLDKSEDEPQKKLHPLLFIIPLAIISFFAWNWYLNSLDAKRTQLDEERNQKVEKSLYHTSHLTMYRLSSFTKEGVVTLEGEVPSVYHKSLALQKVKALDSSILVHNNIKIVNSLNDPMQISSNIAFLVNGMNLSEGVNLKYEYEYPDLKIIGTVWDQDKKMQIVESFNALKSINNVSYNIDISPPKKELFLYFKNGSYFLTKEQKLELLELSKFLDKLDTQTIVRVRGFSDSAGSVNAKRRISLRRAQSVEKVLKNTFFIKQDVLVSGEGESSLDENVQKDSEKQRYVKITLELRG